MSCWLEGCANAKCIADLLKLLAQTMDYQVQKVFDGSCVGSGGEAGVGWHARVFLTKSFGKPLA